ncbi:MAG: sulfurtransferase [Pseudomonadota bacterium]
MNDVQSAGSDCCIVDCRFSLFDPDHGAGQYAQGHLPGAVYAHLDNDLAGDIVFGRSGRHPLPNRDTFAKTLRTWGVNNRTQVFTYDDNGGAFAARLWWLLRWMGHEAVAVIDGGINAWKVEGMPLETDAPNIETGRVTVREPLLEAVGADEVINNSGWVLLDAREPARYRGDAEPIDPVAGHIPGALNHPFTQNLTEDGRFKPNEQLEAQFRRTISDKPIDGVVCYCGSGVTAAHNVLAMMQAGLGTPKLYAGSWSEWIADPERPVARA